MRTSRSKSKRQFFKSTGLEFELGSIKETLRCLGACRCRNERYQGKLVAEMGAGGGHDEFMSTSESLYTVNPPQWLPLQVGLEGQARWLSRLMIYNLL